MDNTLAIALGILNVLVLIVLVDVVRRWWCAPILQKLDKLLEEVRALRDAGRGP